MNGRNGPQYQRVMCFFFFNRGSAEGTNSLKLLCLTFVYVFLYVNLFQD